MVKKGIFGGTFDPIHNGHLYIAHEALHRLNLDEVIFMPSGNPPHKTEKRKTDAAIRYEMVKTAVRDEKYFTVSNYEIKNSGLSYTYKTLEHFNNIENDTEWYFITGADCLVELDYWKSVDRILDSCKLVVFNRPGYPKEIILEQKKRVEEKYKKDIIFLDFSLFDISSTSIKKMIKEQKDASYLMPQGVYNIILELQLYKD
ncbi:nicotinate-nucleotide adenylyltransferase [Clostridium sp. YIM B02515]|uniref:Probable nicotinate-nucleotide adenylyltransferase n=1 Tax=Clostridium rhizosphaerae TaxID=2803861 RepID=A0ABS1T7U8_9CLOT|nr:nicotinate-nucleotide adenylyltransferase [Clostridium rhizosphaerae]MBL4935202.1 nicotinate-nucleotide adenylyltransferase [Clostridium rhizosphaerae]